MGSEAVVIGTWNVEWAPPGSRRGKAIAEALDGLDADLLCLTEALEGFPPKTGETLSSRNGNSYADEIGGKKVLLWSRNGWFERIEPGEDALFAGRFAGGRACTPIGEIQVLGVCIPYAASRHHPDSKRWDDHLSYLARLKAVLSAFTAIPTLVLGDFNQRVPCKRQPKMVFEALMQTFSDRLTIKTAGLLDSGGDDAIDHVAVTPELDFRIRSVLPKVAGNGQRLSDHFGFAGDLVRSTDERAPTQEW